MSDFVSPLLQWLNANPEFAGFVTFLISAAESVAIIGTIVPGSITMAAIGTLAGAGIIPLWATLFWATLGAIVGDGISYWLGHYFKDRLKVAWPFKHYPGLLESGEKFVHKYGVMSILIGRFVGPVRALVPLVAGMLGMKPLHFTIANVISAIGWAPAYLLPGILLGAASLELPPDIAVHVILVIVLIFLFVVLCLWTGYKLLKLFHTQTDQIQNWIWFYLKKHRSLRPFTYLLKHPDPAYTHGQLNLFFYCLATGILFLLLAYVVKVQGAGTLVINDAIYHLFRGIRNVEIDNIMLAFTLLGQKQVLLPVIVILFAWFIFKKRIRTGLHLLAMGFLAAGSVYVFKHLIASPRPVGIFLSPETYSMPSGHATLATVFWIGCVFFLTQQMQQRLRALLYATSILLVLLIGISRLYLGAHWFTDVLAGWLLGATVLMVIIISYQRKEEQPINRLHFVLISLVSLCISFTLYAYTHIGRMKEDYAMESWPSVKIAMNEWWSKNDALPAYRVSLFGFPSQAINIVWAGNLEDIRHTLLQLGWTKPPARNWISTLHRIADIKSTQYLSMISPQYLDQQPELTLARREDEQTPLLVLRLWYANRTIKETNAPIWVGTIGEVPRSYSWLFRTHPGEIDVESDDLLTLNQHNWEWKMIYMNQPTGTKRTIKQKIMLIRKADH